MLEMLTDRDYLRHRVYVSFSGTAFACQAKPTYTLSPFTQSTLRHHATFVPAACIRLKVYSRSGVSMAKRSAMVIMVVMLAISASPKEKKEIVPALIVRAEYVAVIVDPESGISV